MPVRKWFNTVLLLNCEPAQVFSELKQNSSRVLPLMFLGVRGQVDRAPRSSSRLTYQSGAAVGGWMGARGWGDDREEWESATSFKLCNLQIMTGQSGSQGEGISGYAWTSFPAAPHVKAGQWSDRSWRHHVMSPRSGPRGFGQIWYQFRSKPKEAWVGSQQSHKPIRGPHTAQSPSWGIIFWLI